MGAMQAEALKASLDLLGLLSIEYLNALTLAPYTCLISSPHYICNLPADFVLGLPRFNLGTDQ